MEREQDLAMIYVKISPIPQEPPSAMEGMQEFQAGLLWSPEAFAGGGSGGGGSAATLGLSQIALLFGKYIFF